MTSHDEFENALRAWLEGEATPGAPVTLAGSIAAATRGRRQDPAWLAGLRGDHLDRRLLSAGAGGTNRGTLAATLYGDQQAHRRLARMVPVVAVVVLVVVGVTIAVGSLAVRPSTSPSASGAVPPTTAPTQPASPSSGPSSSATPSGSPLASPTPTPMPTAGGTQVAPTIASIPGCIYYLTPSASADGRWYVSCTQAGGQQFSVAAIDIATDTVVATYPLGYDYGRIAIANGLWVSPGLGSACTKPCNETTSVQRIDLATKRVTATFKDRFIAGSGLGYIWIAHQDPNNGPYSIDPAIGLEKIDPSTGTLVGHIPWASGEMATGCATLFGFTSLRTGQSAVTTVNVVDVATGQILNSLAEPGSPGASGQPAEIWPADGSCWIAFATESVTAGTSSEIAELGPSGVLARSPQLAGQALFLDGTFWLLGPNAASGKPSDRWLQRLDPQSWQPSGPTWQLPEFSWPPVAYGGKTWIEQGGTRTILQLGIPVQP